MTRHTGADGHAFGLTVSTAAQAVQVLLLETGDGLLAENGNRLILE